MYERARLFFHPISATLLFQEDPRPSVSFVRILESESTNIKKQIVYPRIS